VAASLKPRGALVLCLAAVGLSTIGLPWIRGYGMVLSQLVVLGAWGLVAAASSGRYADLHHGPVWLAALFLNLVLFLIPAGIFFLTTRRRWPLVSAAGIAIFCAFYLSCLFFLFPATDGP
jgi:hypothetical protein